MILGENYTQNRLISPLEFEKLLMEKENQKSDYTLSTFWKTDHAAQSLNTTRTI
jgi:hypothetical protein